MEEHSSVVDMPRQRMGASPVVAFALLALAMVARPVSGVHRTIFLEPLPDGHARFGDRYRIRSDAISVVGGVRALVLDESEGVLDITYRSLIKEYTVMHIHGVNPQQNSDGEDGFPLQARWMIAPGASKRVQYALGQSGTFFMHSHFNMQQEQGLILPLVIREGSPPAGYPLPTLHAAQEALMVLEERCPYPAADPAPPHCLDGSWSQSALQAKVLASMRADWDDISDTVAAADHEAQCVAPANDTDVYFLHSLVNGQASSHLTLPAAGGGGGEGGDQGEGGEQGQDLVRVESLTQGPCRASKCCCRRAVGLSKRTAPGLCRCGAKACGSALGKGTRCACRIRLHVQCVAAYVGISACTQTYVCTCIHIPARKPVGLCIYLQIHQQISITGTRWWSPVRRPSVLSRWRSRFRARQARTRSCR